MIPVAKLSAECQPEPGHPPASGGGGGGGVLVPPRSNCHQLFRPQQRPRSAAPLRLLAAARSTAWIHFQPLRVLLGTPRSPCLPS